MSQAMLHGKDFRSTIFDFSTCWFANTILLTSVDTVAAAGENNPAMPLPAVLPFFPTVLASTIPGKALDPGARPSSQTRDM